MDSALSVEDMVVPMDTWPEALKAAPTSEHKTVIKCMSVMSWTLAQFPPSPHTASMTAVPSPKWPPVTPSIRSPREASVAPHQPIILERELLLSSHEPNMAQGFPTLSSPAKASPLQLSPHVTAPIDTKEACTEVPNQAKSCQQFISHIGAPTSLILS